MISANLALFIRAALAESAKQIAKIYDWYVEHSAATFKTKAVSSEEIVRRVKSPESDSSGLVVHGNGAGLPTLMLRSGNHGQLIISPWGPVSMLNIARLAKPWRIINARIN